MERPYKDSFTVLCPQGFDPMADIMERRSDILPSVGCDQHEFFTVEHCRDLGIIPGDLAQDLFFVEKFGCEVECIHNGISCDEDSVLSDPFGFKVVCCSERGSKMKIGDPTHERPQHLFGKGEVFLMRSQPSFHMEHGLF